MDKLEKAAVVALKAMKGTSQKEGCLRYLYVQNWMTNILIKCNPYIDIKEFYKKLEEENE